MATNCSRKPSACRSKPEIKQRLSVNSSVLAMGYQRFIPNFAGLRFDMDDKGWHSFLAMDELENQPDFDFKPVWQAMPLGASACVTLPVAAEPQKPLLVKLGAEEAVAQNSPNTWPARRACAGTPIRGCTRRCWWPV
jgi:uncharacterized protein YfaA (DUF2138 family)